MNALIINNKKWYYHKDVNPSGYLKLRKFQNKLGEEGKDWIMYFNRIMVSERVKNYYSKENIVDKNITPLV